MKSALRRILFEPNAKYFFLVSDGLALVTLVSILAIVLETVPRLEAYSFYFWLVEWITVTIFTIEYVLRLLVAKSRTQYALGFYGVVDLLSIAPTLLGLGNFTFLKSARIVRILRFLRMVRLSKIRRLRVADIDHATNVLLLNTSIYFTLLLSSLLFFGVLVHILEPGNSDFSSIPAGMWWAFRSFTGDTPVLNPVSPYADTLYVLARFTGLVLLGALVGVTGNIMQHYLLGRPGRRR